jgi:hypothetical protein
MYPDTSQWTCLICKVSGFFERLYYAVDALLDSNVVTSGTEECHQHRDWCSHMPSISGHEYCDTSNRYFTVCGASISYVSYACRCGAGSARAFFGMLVLDFGVE